MRSNRDQNNLFDKPQSSRNAQESEKQCNKLGVKSNWQIYMYLHKIEIKQQQKR